MTKPCTALHSAEVEHGYADFRARREATVWQRLNRILLVLLIIAIWLVIVSLFVPPYKKLMQSRTEIEIPADIVEPLLAASGGDVTMADQLVAGLAAASSSPKALKSGACSATAAASSSRSAS